VDELDGLDEVTISTTPGGEPDGTPGTDPDDWQPIAPEPRKERV
jgi:hypothetical protein